MRWLRVLFVVAMVLGLLASVGITPHPALAASIEVGSSAEYPCDRDGLAAAIGAAAGGTVTFDCADNIINFANGDQILITEDVTIDGSNGGAAIVFDGNNVSRFFKVDDDGKLTIKQVTMLDGYAPEEDRSGHQGGAIYSKGALTISQSAFISNEATFTGGAITSAGALTISQSSFINNGPPSGGNGGALALIVGSAQITSSTFSGNTAAIGSTMYIYSGAGFVQISWSTIVQPANTTSALYLAKSLTLTGVILGGANNHCWSTNGSRPTVTYSLSNDDSCDPGQTASWENQDLLLTPLLSAPINGVSQGFYSPMVGSPAIDVDTSSDPDQLGQTRPLGSHCDIGSIEVFNFPPTVDAGEDYIGDEGEAVQLNGSASDPENDQLTYLWTYAPGSGTDVGVNCAFADATAAETMITCDDDGNFVVTLTVSDVWNPKVADQASLTLDNVDPQIIEFTGSPSTALTGQMVQLFATATDVPGDPLTKTFNCGGGLLVGGNQCQFSRGGAYDLGVVVDDGDGGLAMALQTIQVYDPEFFCVNQWNDSLRMAEADDCSRNESSVSLPLPQYAFLSLCVNNWNGATRASNDCGRSEHQVQVNGQDTLAVCVNQWNGTMRVSERCSRSEWTDWL